MADIYVVIIYINIKKIHYLKNYKKFIIKLLKNIYKNIKENIKVIKKTQL